ncbi:non-heme iron protein [Helicobacter sp. MIT 05-5293]|uniref:hemerythrin family protein n=1 Tax=Helicobacter sp. MIT 05-5293 TaxID=1548149 RepID=UPI0010FD9434|nr:hemerythrin family protein [Helicobacter sp. MIT 05-5293]TLD81957.1 non-heme iron protein [Helicobacter sp. MIT 05-5293]
MLPDWSDEFSVHHEIIDQQHQRLFELAHKAYRIANSPSSSNEIKAILVEFFEYMKTHFKDEEQYMHAIGYPRLEEHKKIHRTIVAEMAGMVKHVGSMDILKEMIATVAEDWLLVHILQEDMQIEKYRKEQMEKNATCEVKEVKYYYYVCACPGKEHKLTESMHIFVSNSSHPIVCKECHQGIILKK